MAKRAKLQRDKRGATRVFEAVGKGAERLGLRRLGNIAGLLILSALVWLGGREIERYVYTHADYRQDASKLIIRELPDWCPAEGRKSIMAKPLAKGVYSITDPTMTEAIARQCEANPWIRRVVSVRKSYNDRPRMAVDIELRRPICAVESGGRYYVIDKDAVVLPPTYRTWPAATLGMPVVKGVGTPPPDDGAPWPDDAVKGAIATLQAIKASREIARHVDITQIDVSNFAGRVDPRASELVIRTNGNHQILWGRSPTRQRFGELTIEQKIRTFERLVANVGPMPGKWDIRFPGGGIVRQSESM